MVYLPAEGPHPTPDDRPFWEACRNRELRFQKCGGCGRFRHPPVPVCPHCHARDCGWEAAAGTPELFSWTVVHHAVNDLVRERVPYIVAVVAFPGCGGVRLVSNVVDAAPADLRLGLPLDLRWEEAENGWLLPRFALAGEAAR